ncbi:hypothetical protein LEP1GSC047_3939 [Leptospira inadai serovar Lyme str. 10]|uniref:PF06611 family protein n=2 Tax=Leptospira inadai serovar Lyme TaxID=293084 RepID=V6HD46_9LEPT|nr:hypothetical protein [Leptospira inadai]EQA37966.1 hypothetical protein LEP1GSC047_3939 [Leptospira inadai serovar Lyme str. 10]PNV75155.1 hypothetical protein BES34_009680 [Leptospira inadai serovar Lyme]
MNAINSISKTVTGLFWIAWIALLFQMIRLIPQYDGIIILFGWVILAAHVIETIIYTIRAPQRGGFKISDAAQVFIFGVFHLIPVSFSNNK